MTDLETQLTEARKMVDVNTHNFSVRELVRMLTEDELNIAPEYQRKYRWNNAIASRFIESVYLGLPIPPIFVATNAGFRWEVVDGLQRLSTLALYVGATEVTTIMNKLPLVPEELEKLPALNDQSFEDLPTPIKRHFNRQPLQVISLTDKSDRQVRFDLFERLNSGAIRLSPQEVRSCIYRGKFNDHLEAQAANEMFRKLIRLQADRDNDGTYAEQVLKFYTYKNWYSKYDGRITNLLNDYMENGTKGFDYKQEEQLFTSSVEHLSLACAGEPFLRARTYVTPLVEFEACLVGIGRLIEAGVTPILPEWDWINDPELLRFCIGGSNTRPRFEGRVQRAESIFSGSATAVS